MFFALYISLSEVTVRQSSRLELTGFSMLPPDTDDLRSSF